MVIATTTTTNQRQREGSRRGDCYTEGKRETETNTKITTLSLSSSIQFNAMHHGSTIICWRDGGVRHCVVTDDIHTAQLIIT